MKQPVAIMGAAGFTGKELLKLLSKHPEMEAVHITSNQHAGRKIQDVFPDLSFLSDMVFKNHEDHLPEKIPVFLAVPNETSLELVPALLQRGHKVVDLSGSFRLSSRELFEKYYKINHHSFSLIKERVFGLPEMFRDTIKKANLVANPGCYPTGSIIPLHLLKTLHENISFVSIDAKSGVSGAGGRVEDAGFSFNSVHENFRAYKILKHQHQPEIEEFSFFQSESKPPLVFTPHLLPLFRGILSTIVIHWKTEVKDPGSIMRDTLKQEPFIRFYDEPEQIELSRVQNTNFIDISQRTEGRITVVVSALDNLQKGAAGQAIQNMNLMLGFTETSGLLSTV